MEGGMELGSSWFCHQLTRVKRHPPSQTRAITGPSLGPRRQTGDVLRARPRPQAGMSPLMLEIRDGRPPDLLQSS